MLLINEPELARAAKQTVKKLWGAEYVIINNDLYCCKFLKINPGYRSSVHAHHEKDETFIGVMGVTLLKTYDAKGQFQIVYAIHPGAKVRISPRTFHSFEAQTASWVMEVSTPHSDADVERIEPSKNLMEQERPND